MISVLRVHTLLGQHLALENVPVQHGSIRRVGHGLEIQATQLSLPCWGPTQVIRV